MRKNHYDRHFKLSGEEFIRPRNTKAAFGDIFSDAGDVISSAGDVFTSAVDKIPGGQALRQALGDKIGDFARTTFGQVVLRAAATAATGMLAQFPAGGSYPLVSPQLASAAFAIPALAAGDKNFLDAWLSEFKWRVETAAQTVAPEVGKQITNEVNSTLASIPALQALGKTKVFGHAIQQVFPETVEGLVNKFGIREDSAALVLAALHKAPIPSRGGYDFKSGKHIKTTMEKARFVAAGVDPGMVTMTMQEKALAAAKLGNAMAQVKKHEQAKQAVYGTAGTGLGLGAALLLGASWPFAIGAAALLGLAGLFTAKKTT